MKNYLIIVMDVGDPAYLDSYDQDQETNDKFISYLNEKLLWLSKNGATIVFSNFIGKTHPLLTIEPDRETTSINVLVDFIKSSNFEKIVYVGLHWPVCTHDYRSTSSHSLHAVIDSDNIYVCPFLSRPLYRLYGGIPPTDNDTKIKQIML
jgi:hypothetical protein